MTDKEFPGVIFYITDVDTNDAYSHEFPFIMEYSLTYEKCECNLPDGDDTVVT